MTSIGPLSIDIKGLEPCSEQSPEGHLSQCWKKLQSRFHEGDVGFFHTPSDTRLSQVNESVELAKNYSWASDCIFLGIGGSALGPDALLKALSHRSRQPRFHFFDNPDPVDWTERTKDLTPDKTLVCVVTKSGGTFETMAQFLVALDWLGKDRWKKHIVGITDPKKGDLRSFLLENEIPALHIAPSIGGRFSVFTPVGTFALALAGHSPLRFLEGAGQVRETLTSIEKSPIGLISDRLVQSALQYPTHVFFPYSTKLKPLGEWWVQLWGESLGKNAKGFDPISAVGATDQHSLLQLLRDGPDNKVTFFVEVQKSESVPIPKPDFTGLPAFSRVGGQSFEKLLQIEKTATERVLTNRNRPHLTIRIKDLSEESLGALTFFFCTSVSLVGTLLGVDPFDQPGVEEAKVYIREALESSTK